MALKIMNEDEVSSQKVMEPYLPKAVIYRRKKVFPSIRQWFRQVWLRCTDLVANKQSAVSKLSTVVWPRICYTRIKLSDGRSRRLWSLCSDSGVGLLKYQYRLAKHYLFRKRWDADPTSKHQVMRVLPGNQVLWVDRSDCDGLELRRPILCAYSKDQEIARGPVTCRAKFTCGDTLVYFLRL